MINKSTVTTYTIKCDSCGKKIVKNDLHNEKVKIDGNTSGEYDKFRVMYDANIFKYSTGVDMSDKDIIPTGWFVLNAKTLCSEECISALLKKSQEAETKEILEKYKKQILDNLKK